MNKKTIARFWRISFTTFLMSGLLAFSGYSQFITTWKTDNVDRWSNSNSTQIEIPGVGDYTVAWEQVGNSAVSGTTNARGTVGINFPSAGTYKISITGNFRGMSFTTFSDRNKLLTVEQWGNFSWNSMESAFDGCSNMTYNATDMPNLSQITSLNAMFRGCKKFNGNISNWNVSNVRNMDNLFNGAVAFNQPIGNWDVSKVTTMSGLFVNAEAFNQPIGNWNVAMVTNMSSLFFNARVFNQPIGNWNVSKVTDMESMFSNARVFNQPIGNWNVSKVTDMGSMFQGADAFNQPIGNWDVSEVTNMETMFREADTFNQPIGSWVVSKVTSMRGMFENARAFNHPIGNWDVRKVTNMSQMFAFFATLADAPQGKVRQRTSGSNSSFNQPLNNWKTDNVINLSFMFSGADSFNQPLNNWFTGKVNNMSNMFQGATHFNQNLGDWNITEVTGMSNMLSGSGLSLGNYDRTLTAWAAQFVKSNVRLGATGQKYCASETSRNTLANTKNWIITGDVKECPTNDIEVQVDGVEISSGGVVDFGTTRSLTKTVTIHNIGVTSAVVLSGAPLISVTSGTAFAVTEQPNASSIAPGGSVTFKVTYTASTNNDLGTISISSNDPDEATYTIELKGVLEKQDQTIVFNLGNNPTKAFGDAAFDLIAMGGASGNAVTFASSNANVATISGKTLTIVGTGTTIITASQAGNNAYNAAADVTQTLTVTKANQTITFDLGNNANKAFGAANFDFTATGGASGNAVTFTSSDPNVATISGKTLTIVGAGTTTITASQAGNDNYNAAADITQTLTVTKGNQTITFDLGNNANKTLGAANFDLIATGGASGNAITFTSSDPSVATISGATVTIVGLGTTTITASQAGNNNYSAAVEVTQTLTVQSTITSLSQQLNSSKIIVFPNPTSDMLRIEIPQKTAYNYVEITILNQQGKKVMFMGRAIKNGQVAIPVETLASGQYLLQINAGGETIMHRIVKL